MKRDKTERVNLGYDGITVTPGASHVAFPTVSCNLTVNAHLVHHSAPTANQEVSTSQHWSQFRVEEETQSQRPWKCRLESTFPTAQPGELDVRHMRSREASQAVNSGSSSVADLVPTQMHTYKYHQISISRYLYIYMCVCICMYAIDSPEGSVK